MQNSLRACCVHCPALEQDEASSKPIHAHSLRERGHTHPQADRLSWADVFLQAFIHSFIPEILSDHPPCLSLLHTGRRHITEPHSLGSYLQRAYTGMGKKPLPSQKSEAR